jgi:hypothetical protein
MSTSLRDTRCLAAVCGMRRNALVHVFCLLTVFIPVTVAGQTYIEKFESLDVTFAIGIVTVVAMFNATTSLVFRVP